MKSIYFLLCLWFSTTFVYAGNYSKYFLDNYLIPVNSPGALIGKLVPAPQHVSILNDTSSLFKVSSKEKAIYLKSNKVVSEAQKSFRYGISLLVDGETVELELVKDGFSKNSVVAHRGVWKRPGVLQNSIRSFMNAVELGCEGSEFDVWLTSDNVVVLSHDPQVYGIDIENTTALQLFQQTINEKDPVPSLKELLLCARNQNVTHPIIEIKDSQKGLSRTLALTDSVVSLVHKLKMQGFVKYISFNYESLKRIRELDPTAEVQYLWEDKKKLADIVNDKISGIDYSFYAYQKDEELLHKAKKAGLLTNVWTVNKAEDLLLYVKQGFDLITTDEPELLIKIIKTFK